MRDKIIAFILGVALAFSLTMAINPASAGMQPAPVVTKTTSMANYDIKSVKTQRYMGDSDSGLPEGNTKGRIWFKVYSNKIVAYKIKGYYNMERDTVRCDKWGKFKGTSFTWTVTDGRKVSVVVPCRTDGVHSKTKRIDLRIYAPRPCAVVPCPPMTQVRARHTMKYFLTDDASWNSPKTEVS